MKQEKTLAFLRPEVAAQWHPEKNGALTPGDVTAFSGRKVWWICGYGHEWVTAVCQRSYGTGCPVCAAERKSSFAEQAIWFYLKQRTVARNRYRELGKEIDVYLPERKTGIEHNGSYYHRGKQQADEKKVQFFREKGIRILTVKEGTRECITGDTVEYICRRKDSLNWAIDSLAEMLGLGKVGADVAADEQRIFEQYLFMQKKTSLAGVWPEIADQWHPEKNGTVRPEMVSAVSGKRVWWICGLGHEWRTSVACRVKGSGCPVCAGKQILPGFNDLATTNPEMAKQWDDEKNGDLTPQRVSRGSKAAVWWKCSQGHRWQTPVAYRIKGEDCPYCANKRVEPGFNDLQTTDPMLAAQWNVARNLPLKPETVTRGSDKSVWWRCEKGHEWKAVIGDRSRGNGCPYCAGKRLIPGQNDLATVDPALAAQWHPHKNGMLTPRDVTAVAGRAVWWRCSEGHAWKALISNRRWGNGCPYCANRKILPGYNDLKTCHPEIAAQWNREKNGELSADMVMAGSGRRVWWQCEKGHEWQARILSRTQGVGCPHCYRERRRGSRRGKEKRNEKQEP